MAFDPDAIHRALAAQLNTNIADDWNVSPWPLSDKPPGDLIEIWPDDEYITYWGSFSSEGVGTIRVRIRLEVAGGNPETVFKKITRALASGTDKTSSIVDAVMDDRTLGGVVQTAMPQTAEWPINEETLGTVAWVSVWIVAKKTGASV